MNFSSDNAASSIRFPSTANLFISSADRNNDNYPSASDFVIQKNENILAGYFTRFGMVEINISWFLPNISALLENNTITVTLTGQPAFSVVFPDGFYSVASVANLLVINLNNQFGPGTFSLVGTDGLYSLTSATTFLIDDTSLARDMSFTTSVTNPTPVLSNNFYFPYLIPSEYSQLDFVCTNLTYQQGLKDADTASISRDVIYRWTMGWDDEPRLDSLGYPILQGYTSFNTRRYLSFPKQIRWGRDQPLGQLSFQVYGADGKILRFPGDTVYAGQSAFWDWGMAMLVSEQ
jgi:hypothetical protein